ncbi:MAG TPA: hypothetical protein EYQ26_10725 [Rhodospirillales bacterium]|nr:hypothetical protein [Rhodospirillales bacterium]
MKYNKWRCIGCLEMRNEKDFLHYGIRAFDDKSKQALCCALCSQCIKDNVWGIPNVIVKNIKQLTVDNSYQPQCVSAMPMLVVHLKFNGDLRQAMQIGCSPEEMEYFNVLWQNIDDFTVLPSMASLYSMGVG